MHRLLLVAALGLAALPAPAGELQGALAVDWTPGLRAGLEYAVSARQGVKVDIGASLQGALVADLFCVTYLRPDDARLRLNVLLGLPMVIVPFGFDGASVVIGGSLLVGYWVTPRIALDLRLGAGVPIMVEEDRTDIGENLPLPIWPDLALGVSVRLCGTQPASRSQGMVWRKPRR